MFFTVVIPTYNRERSVVKAIDSVLSQTHKELELIVVDDGSTDCTSDRIGEIADSRLTYVKLPKKSGANAARNKGIQLAKGEFVGFLDSDDIWLSEKLDQAVVAFSGDSKLDWTFSPYVKISARKSRIVPDFVPNCGIEKLYKEILKYSFIGTPTLIAKKAALVSVGGFDEKLGRLQDWDLVIRLSERYKAKFLREPLVLAFDMDRAENQAEQISCQQDLGSKAKIYLFSKHHHRVHGDKTSEPKWLLSAARAHKAVGTGNHRTMFLKLAKKYPTKAYYLLQCGFGLIFPSHHYFAISRILDAFGSGISRTLRSVWRNTSPEDG